MSKYTWERIPPNLAHTFHVYQAACERQQLSLNVVIRQFLKRSSDRYGLFVKDKLSRVQGNEMNRKHFDPMVAEVLSPILKLRYD